MKRRFGVLIAVAVTAMLALAAGIYVGMIQSGADRDSEVGRDAGALFGVSLPDSQGREQSLGQWKGKVVLINFWATWCAPCRAEMPEFVRAQNEIGGRGLQVVGIAIDSVDAVQPFIREIGVNYPTLIGGYGAMELSKSFGNKLMALPYTIVVNRDGRIAHTQLGPLTEERLRAIVGKLL